MDSTPSPRGATPKNDFAVLRLAKRALLVLFGPAYFLCVAFAPLLCGRRKGFRGWYWRLVKRACSRLLWLLSVRATMSTTDKATLSADTGSVIVINHRSHLDGFALMHVIPDDKWFTFAAKREFWKSRPLRTGFDAAGLVPIERSSGAVAMQTLTDAVSTMPARRSVVLFPEGTRTGSTSLGPFKSGAIRVARDSGRHILPIVIHDSSQLLPRGRFFPLSGTITVEVLPKFSVDPEASVEAETARLRDAMVTVFDRGPRTDAHALAADRPLP